MVRPQISLKGLPELRALLQDKQRDDETDAVLEEAAYELEARWKSRAPVDTGRYRSSISTMKVGPMAFAIVSNVYYGPFVEFGTGQKGKASPQPGGVPPEYVHGSRIGMPAAPAARTSLIEVSELLKEPSRWSHIV